MTKILITGKSGYISNELAIYFKKIKMDVDVISVRNLSESQIDLSSYDVVIHAAALVHQKKQKSIEEYYKVNRDLTADLANMCKKNGVKHFIFFSTMNVFGVQKGEIKQSTSKKPITHYGKSKLAAEDLLIKKFSSDFTLSIIRPPMVYGKKCKGNYNSLSKLAKLTPVFPNLNNKRSVLYIENLCFSLEDIILNNKKGFFHPQNKEKVSGFEIIKQIRSEYGKNTYEVNFFNPIISFLCKKSSVFQKVFGDLTYSNDLSKHNIQKFIRFDESISKTEVGMK